MRYENFDVRIEPDGEAFRVRASCGGRQGSSRFGGDLVAWVGARCRSWDGGAVRNTHPTGPPAGDLLRSSPADPWAEEIGDRLFRNLFGGSVGTCFEKSLSEVERYPEKGLRIRLWIDPAEPRLAPIAGLPWEGSYNPYTERALCLDRRTPIVRSLDTLQLTAGGQLGGPLRVLLATAEPRGLPPLALAEEQARIEKIFCKRRDVHVDVHAHTTRTDLRDLLVDRSYDVLHIMSHGSHEPDEGSGSLALEDARGGADYVSATDIKVLVGDRTGLSLIVLNACHTSRGDVSNPLTTVAAQLVREGFPALIGMASAILDGSAITFSETLYKRLAVRDPIEAAVTEGRIALSQSPSTWPGDWAIPRLFLQGSPASLASGQEGAEEDRREEPRSGRRQRQLDKQGGGFQQTVTIGHADQAFVGEFKKGAILPMNRAPKQPHFPDEDD